MQNIAAIWLFQSRHYFHDTLAENVTVEPPGVGSYQNTYPVKSKIDFNERSWVYELFEMLVNRSLLIKSSAWVQMLERCFTSSCSPTSDWETSHQGAWPCGRTSPQPWGTLQAPGGDTWQEVEVYGEWP